MFRLAELLHLRPTSFDLRQRSINCFFLRLLSSFFTKILFKTLDWCDGSFGTDSFFWFSLFLETTVTQFSTIDVEGVSSVDVLEPCSFISTSWTATLLSIDSILLIRSFAIPRIFWRSITFLVRYVISFVLI